MKRRIYSAYTDASVRLGAAQTMYIVQDSLSRWQRDKMCGNCEVRELGLFWVVTKSQVNFHRYPAWDSEVEVCYGFAPAGRIRTEFSVTIKDEKGVAIEARQEYCMLDFERHRPQKLEQVPNFTPDLEALPTAAYQRFAAETGKEVHIQQVLPHMIDMSGHLNNVEYVKLALDCFDGEFLRSKEVAWMEAHHLKECIEGQRLTLCRQDDGAESVCRIFCEDILVFEIKFVWRDKV